MKTTLKSTVAALSLVILAAFAFSGCVSTNKTAGKSKRALVCPQCKMVAEMVDFHDDNGPSPVDSHTCPNCQGAMTTLFKEGKLKHKCSVCKDSPFTCPVFHPTST